jgi:hypothetical protein
MHSAYLVSPVFDEFGLGHGLLRAPEQEAQSVKTNVFLLRPSVGQALANNALSQFAGAVGIVNANALTGATATVYLSTSHRTGEAGANDVRFASR